MNSDDELRSRPSGPLVRLTAIDVPFLVTVLFTVIAWSTVHFIDRNTSSPLVEYKMNKRCDKPKAPCLFEIQLTNLSFEKKFSNLEVEFLIEAAAGKPPDTAFFYDASSRAVAPAWDAQKESLGKPPTSVSFEIADLQPGSTVVLEATYAIGDKPLFSLKSADDAIRLKKRGILTLIVRSEGYLLILAILGSVLAVGAWFLRLFIKLCGVGSA